MKSMRQETECDGVQHTTIGLCRAGKAKGQYLNWYNVQHVEPNGSEEQNMSQVDKLHTECENTEADVLITKDISFNAAKQQEIKKWRNNDVYDVDTDKGQNCILT